MNLVNPKLRYRCPSCERQLAPIPWTVHAEGYMRTCRKCRQRWWLLVKPRKITGGWTHAATFTPTCRVPKCERTTKVRCHVCDEPVCQHHAKNWSSPKPTCTRCAMSDPCAICDGPYGIVDAQWDGREVKVCRSCFEYETREVAS